MSIFLPSSQTQEFKQFKLKNTKVRSETHGNYRYICREWVESVIATDPEYFERVKSSQAPMYLWIGCSDSRVVAERALGLGVGKLFVHRNVGNCLSHADQNAMSALEYSVQARVCSLVPWNVNQLYLNK